MNAEITTPQGPEEPPLMQYPTLFIHLGIVDGPHGTKIGSKLWKDFIILDASPEIQIVLQGNGLFVEGKVLYRDNLQNFQQPYWAKFNGKVELSN